MPQRTAKRQPRQTYGAALLAALCAFALMGNARPQPPFDSSGFSSAARVADEDLADIRGKFVSAEDVRYFGIALQTVWQTEDGAITTAQMSFDVSFDGNGSATPQATVAWVRGGDPAMEVPGDGSNAVVVNSSAEGLPGLNSVNGAVQSNVIAGTDNRVANAMAVRIVPTDEVPTTPAGEAITQTRTDVAADGDTIRFVVESGQLGLVVQDAQGAGVVRQMIAETPGQLSQNVFLAGRANLIDNMMNVTIGVDPLQQHNQIQIVNALSALKGHGF